MLFKLILLCAFVFCDAILYEGQSCVKDGRAGTCTNVNLCLSAIIDIRSRKMPQICSFVGSDPIVCCLDYMAPSPQARFVAPTSTTTKKPVPVPVMPNPPVYPPAYPPGYPYNMYNDECEPIPSEMTSKKTGQKAFDKCIEYQEKYVYPCTEGMDLMGSMSRSNQCNHNADELIVGGTNAAENEFPHMAMIGYDTLDKVQWLCGGAVISERFILTAAHCTAHRDLGRASYVLIGALARQDAEDRSKIYKIKRIISHPFYRPPIKYNDIALMETENEIQLDQYVVPACLHVGDAVNDTRIIATGWGLTQYSGSTSEILQKVFLNKFSTEKCSEKYPAVRLMRRGFNPASQLCYGDMEASKDTCQGDSGGPIQINSEKIHCMYTVVGVTSFGRACGFIGEPGIYTRVAHYVSWIERIVWPN